MAFPDYMFLNNSSMIVYAFIFLSFFWPFLSLIDSNVAIRCDAPPESGFDPMIIVGPV